MFFVGGKPLVEFSLPDRQESFGLKNEDYGANGSIELAMDGIEQRPFSISLNTVPTRTTESLTSAEHRGEPKPMLKASKEHLSHRSWTVQTCNLTSQFQMTCHKS